MDDAPRFLAGYIVVSPTLRPKGWDSAIPDPYITVSSCLADHLRIPKFSGWYQDFPQARRAHSENASSRILALSLDEETTQWLQAEFADEPHHFDLLRRRVPSPTDADRLGHEIVGAEYGLALHSWLCYDYVPDLMEPTRVTLNTHGLIEDVSEAHRTLEWIRTRPSGDAPAPVPWFVVALADVTDQDTVAPT